MEYLHQIHIIGVYKVQAVMKCLEFWSVLLCSTSRYFNWMQTIFIFIAGLQDQIKLMLSISSPVFTSAALRQWAYFYWLQLSLDGTQLSNLCWKLKLSMGKVIAIIPQAVTKISAVPLPGSPCVTSFFVDYLFPFFVCVILTGFQIWPVFNNLRF